MSVAYSRKRGLGTPHNGEIYTLEVIGTWPKRRRKNYLNFVLLGHN
jgi:hypothetical protein